MISEHLIFVILALLFLRVFKKYNRRELVGLAIFTILFSILMGRYLTRFRKKSKGSDKVVTNKVSTNQEVSKVDDSSKDDENVAIKKSGEKSSKFDIDSIRPIIERNIGNNFDDIVLENDEIIAHFSLNGGCISKVVLKKYKNHRGENVVLVDRKNIINFELVNLGINTYDLKFLANKLSDSELEFSLIDENHNIVILYKLGVENKFEILQTIKTVGNSEVNFTFDNILLQNEYNLDDCKNKSSINYFENDTVKSLYFSNNKKVEKISNCKWVAFKQKFFTSGFSPENQMNGEVFIRGNDRGVNESNLCAKLVSENNCFNIKYFFGPNKYKILQTFADSFGKNIYLGIPLVSSLNRYIILPFSEYLGEGISSVLVIVILVILIKLLILPINLKIYIITRKIKLLNEIINVLKEKYKNNQQRLAIEQINVYREFGVNPLSVLLYNIIQFPFIIAIYNFIPVEIMFRHSKFLWCNDISSSDYVFNLGFNIPFYGDNVSLSAVLMGLTILAYTFFSEISFDDMKNNESKTKIGVPHVFLMIFMVCISTKFCCALNIYYIFFNIVTFVTQILFAKYIKDDGFQHRVKVKINQIR